MLVYEPKPEDQLAEQAPLAEVTHLHIEMGYQCNYRCSFCYQVDFSAKQNMDEFIWRERLRGLYPGLKSVFLQGGEPTIMKNCIGLRDLLVAEHPHVKMGIVTNGLRLDEQWTDILIDQGYMVQFSLNGSTKTIYDRTMKFGNYEGVMANLRRLVARKATAGRDDLDLAVSYVIVPENVCELADFIAFADAEGINTVKFFTDQLLSAASTDTAGTLREIERAYAAQAAHPNVEVSGIEAFEQLYRTRHGLMAQDPTAAARCACSRAKDLCQIPWQQVYVKHKGEVTFCCMTWRNVGNLHDDDIETIWNNAKAREFRRRMMRDNFAYCSPSCLSNRKPDFSALWSARKFAQTVVEDPDLVWKKARNKVGKIIGQRKSNTAVDADYPSIQPVKKPKAGTAGGVID